MTQHRTFLSAGAGRRTPRTRAARVTVLLAAGGLALPALAACGGGSGFEEEGGEAGGDLEILIGSSGDAETAAVKEAVSAWSSEAGTGANVSVAADLVQQLSQGFASGNPPDLFYVGTDSFPGYAANGSLFAYGDQLENVDDFYPTLAETFTFEDQLFCAPKDFSTLALVVNTDAWSAAGLTEDDYPTTWEELKTVATTLTTPDQAGLAFGPEWQRIGTFMAQAGGHLVDDNLSADVDTPENLEALTYVKDLLTTDTAKFPSDVGSGWGGEAFGTGAAAMTIEGNWIIGAMENDFPDINYAVVPLPEGPAGPGTLQFTNCWGIAADSPNQEAAVDLVQYLTSAEQQMTFATEFGVMPSIQSVAEEWKGEFPEQAAFLDGAEFAQGVPPIEGIADVISDFNAQIEGLKSGDPQATLTSVQSTLEAVAP